MIEQIKKRLEQGIREKIFPGAVVGVLENGNRSFVSSGKFTYAMNSEVITDDTTYDVASITKTIPVSLLAVHYIEEGLLSLDDQVITYIPEITIENREKGLIQHLLTYTYMLEKNPDPHFSYANYSAEQILDFFYTRPFKFLPGTRHEYSNTPPNLLGIILERISGKKLYTLAQEIILQPLQMTHSTFSPSNVKSIPPTEITNWRGEIQGEVHDETAYLLQKAGYNPGCAGLFSNTDDLLNPAEMILGRGDFRGHRLFNDQSFSRMTTNVLDTIGQSCAIGWELNQPKFMGQYAHEHMIGKTGFTGTCIVLDPKTNRAFVMLSNRTYPKRPGNAVAINAVRRDIADIVFAP